MANMVASRYENFRAPKGDRTSLVSPSITENVQRLSSPHEFDFTADGGQVEFCGKSLETARGFAREEIVQLAVAYTNRYSQAPAIDPAKIASTPIILSGHQPELFHPGVWFKNFLLADLAAKSNAIGINFLVDNDLCRSPALRVPQRDGSADLTSSTAAMDVSGESVPWELRKVHDRAMFEQFPKSLRRSLPESIQSPLAVDAIWPEVTRAVDDGWNLGQALARGRHHLERKNGLNTLEVPLSQIAQTRSFARFSIQLLSQLPRFQFVYNDQLKRYREAHKIRNHAHPVPELGESDGWLEAPLWIYRADATERQRLWVRIENDELHLSDREGWTATISGRLDCDNAATQWLKIAEAGAFLRPRALLTTMFMRLFVGDLFIHGIGGAKYDQLTDTIIKEFFGIVPPPVCVATATVQLPITQMQRISDEAIEEAKGRVWRLQHNPDQELALSGHDADKLVSLVEKKRDLLANIPERGDKWQWHTQLKEIKQQLAALAGPALEQAQRDLQQLEQQQRQDAVSHSREYSFALFPLETIISDLRSLL